MKYKGIIFDLDGVLCFTDQYHYQAWKEIADKIGVFFNEAVNNRLRGVSRMASLDIILENSPKEYSLAEKEELAEKKNVLYKNMLQKMSPADLTKEVKDTLDALKMQGLKLAVGSSSRNAKLILSRIGLSDYFDAVSDGTNITHSKPDPEVFLKAAGFLGLEPAECLVVEDAAAGIDAAIAGGFDGAGLGEASTHEKVTWPLNTFQDLLKLSI